MAKTGVLDMAKIIDWGIRFFLFLLIFSLPFTKAAVAICTYSMLMLWLIKRVSMFVFRVRHLSVQAGKRGSKFVFLLEVFKPSATILNKPIGLFIFVAFLSVIGSLHFADSLIAFLGKTLRGMILYFMIAETIKTKRHVFLICGLLFFSTLLVSLDGFIQYFLTGTDILYGRQMDKGAISATLNHPNSLGAYLNFSLLLLLAIIMRIPAKKEYLNTLRRTLQSVGFIVLLCLFSLGMVLTKSRGAWLGTIVGILMLSALRSRKVFAWIIISGVLTFSLFYLFVPKLIVQKFRLEPALIQNTSFSRMVIWKDTLAMIKNRPFLGHGINTYMKEFQKYREAPWGNPTYAHNCYLQIAAEMGLCGLIAFLWIITRLFRSTVGFAASYKDDVARINKHITFGLLAGLAAFLAHSFFDTNLYSLQLSTMFWYMTGLVVVCNTLGLDVNK